MGNKTYKYLDLDGLGAFYDNLKNQLTPFIEITYEILKSKRDNNELIPGSFYRITDYITTTTQANTQSAGNQFDIIVTANSYNSLSEEARACLHSGDTYFSENGANLEAWQIWYCLDNDTNRFAWADSTNGKGVIYRMIDEWGNDCPYDFKNILSKHPNDANDTLYYYTFSWVNENSIPEDLTLKQTLVNDAGKLCGTHNNVILHWFDNYDQSLGNPRQKLNRNLFIYSYSYANGLFYGCGGNRIGYESRFNTFQNNTSSTIIGDDCYNNSFGNICYSNNIGNECYKNSFAGNNRCNVIGDSCYMNTLGEQCSYNVFGEGCRSNTFGNISNNNKLGTNCDKITTGTSFQRNDIGNSCIELSFGDSCQDNVIGSECQNFICGKNFDRNKFGNKCNSVDVGIEFQDNIIGNNCSFTIGNYSSDNEIGNYFSSVNTGTYFSFNKIGDNCTDWEMGSHFEHSEIGDNVYNIRTAQYEGTGQLKNYFRNIKISSNSQYLWLYTSDAQSIDGNIKYVQNYIINDILSDGTTLYLKRGLDYITNIALDKNGSIVEYCTEDLYIDKNKIIEYTTNNNEIIEDVNNGFGDANIVHHSYYNGKGRIIFDAPITSIGNYAFHECTSLKSITIPNSVTTIGVGAFYGCTSLKSITIPYGVTNIGEYAFEYCTSLASITIPNSVIEIGNRAFLQCIPLTSITIPDSVTSIGVDAFTYTSLSSIIIPDSVTKIGKYAFNYIGTIKDFTIGSSVTSIGNDIFEGTKVITIYCKPIVPPSLGMYGLEDPAGESIPDKIYVPIESVDLYKNTEIWSNYSDRIIGCVFEDEPVLVLSDVDIEHIISDYFQLSFIGSGSGSGSGISEALVDEADESTETTE